MIIIFLIQVHILEDHSRLLITFMLILIIIFYLTKRDKKILAL